MLLRPAIEIYAPAQVASGIFEQFQLHKCQVSVCRKSYMMAEGATLDEEFRRIISEMKPHARLLPHRSEERHKVTLWIKKLLGLQTQKEERNKYAKLLLQMLKGGGLEAPFLDNPPSGPLKMPNILLYPPRIPSPNDLDSLLMSSPEDTIPSVTVPANHRSTLSSTRTGRQSQSQLYSKSGLVQSNLTSDETLGYRQSLGHYSRTSPSRTSGTLSHLTHSHKNRTKRPGEDKTGNTGRRADGSLSRRGEADFTSSWKGGHPNWSVGTHDSTFQPKLTSTLAASKGVGHLSGPKSSSSDISEDSLESNEDILRHGLSDEASTNGDISDVAALLQSKPRPVSTALAPTHYSPLGSYNPRVSLTTAGSISRGSPRKVDISRELLHAREVELKVKSAETRFQEEKLRLQRHHEEALKQILDRKNNELEDVQSEHRIRVHQLETQCRKLERKVSHLDHECAHLREQRDHHLGESRQSSHQVRQQLQTEFDKKLHSAIMEFEREKLESEQKHSKQIQHMLEETSTRMEKVESEYNSQTQANSEVITELEIRVQELTREAESLQGTHSRLAQEKVALEQRCATLETELQEARENMSHLEQEGHEMRGERDSVVRQARARTEQTVQELQRKHSIREAKISEQITELKHRLSHWQQVAEENRRKHLEQEADLESSHQQQLREREARHEKQLTALRNKMKQQELHAQENQKKLENSLQECEQQVAELKTAQEIQSHQAEHAIEDFKTQVERQTGEMFDQMRGELERVEADLSHSRAMVEKQSQEFAQQREEERKKAEKKLSDVCLYHEQEKTQLKKEQEKARESALAKLSSNMADIEAKARANASHDAKVISSLEGRVRELQSQLEEVRSHHERKITETKKRAEEEKQTVVRIHESAISKLRAQLESQRGRLKRDHKEEIHTLTEKHNHRVKQLEHNFALKTAQTTETISSLQAQLRFQQEDMESQQRSHENQTSDVVRRNAEEKASVQQHQEMIIKSLQQEADAAQTIVSQLEKRNRQLHMEHERKVSHLRLQYETKMKGMIPTALKKEYEDTIKSLRTQVNMLSQRASILQEELDRRHPTSSHGRLSGPPSTSSHGQLSGPTSSHGRLSGPPSTSSHGQLSGPPSKTAISG